MYTGCGWMSKLMMKSLVPSSGTVGVVEGVAGGVGQARDTAARCVWATNSYWPAGRPGRKVRLTYAVVVQDVMPVGVERRGWATKVAVAMNCDSFALFWLTLTSE